MGEGTVNVDVVLSSSWRWWWLGGRTGEGMVSINVISSSSWWWWLGRGRSGDDKRQPRLIVLFSSSWWLGGGTGEGTASVNVISLSLSSGGRTSTLSHCLVVVVVMAVGRREQVTGQ